jgi:phage baseplate assembly protein W
MSYEFLGLGWHFPVSLDKHGKISQARYEEAVRQSVWIILSTAPGERMMHPDFGCGIHKLVFAPHSAGTAGQLTGEVRRALTLWEPRIDLLDVDAFPDAKRPNLMLIKIQYRVRATNNSFNLVYPLYLE